MKVLQLCGKDFFGAGRAAYRLHKGLQQSGIESVMWVGAKRTNDNSVYDIQSSYLKKKLSKVFVKLEKLFIKYKGGRAKEMFSVGTIGHSIKQRIEIEKPDIIHLHWINRGFFNMMDLKDLNIPVVISLHDMWWYTGGCHYDEECNKYKNSCRECPVLQSNKTIDLSTKHQVKKRALLNSIPSLVFVGLSSWMTNCVKESTMATGKQVVHLPNGIDLDKFLPVDKRSAREKLNLPVDKKMVLFAAVDVLSESRKGYKYINEALKQLDNSYELVVIGEKSNQAFVGGLKTHFIGEINNDQLLIEYMSAADVSVVPSLQENLSNLIMESLSCAIPVVAFNIGGNGDMIKHKLNGYLAESKNIADLAQGIRYCCSSEHNFKLGKYAREFVVNNFEIKNVSEKYIRLYKTLLKEEVNA